MNDTEMEQVVLQFDGGPSEGHHHFRINQWPPPEELAADQFGRYVRDSYSQIPTKHPNLVRGAVYVYKPREEN